MTRILYALLSTVAAAAAVLSFAALRDLAIACGFAPPLAWLVPVVVDAGAAAGSVVWLSRPPGSARRFGRVLALALLGLSIAANGLGHFLAAFDLRPSWWTVVLVSAVAPAVLGATVHLLVLAGRRDQDDRSPAPVTRSESELVRNHLDLADAGPSLDRSEDGSGPDRAGELIAAGAGRRRLARELGVSEHEARQLLDSRRNGDGS